MNKKYGIHGMTVKLMAMAFLPVLILALVLTIYSGKSMREGLQEEALETLHSVAVSLNASYSNLNDEPFYVNEDGDLMKGDYNISLHVDDIDAYVEGTHVDVTVFYGDLRMATSLLDKNGQRIVGTKASEEVVQKVLNAGGHYSSTEITINDENYYCYYIPLKNPGGEIVGMAFAGQPSSDLDSFIAEKVAGLTTVAVVLGIIIVIVAAVIAISFSRRISSSTTMVQALAEGDLTGDINQRMLNGRDEIADMCRAVATMQAQLQQTIGQIQASATSVLHSGDEMEDVAGQCSSTSDEISRAIEDVSRGAVSQAEDIENVTMEVNDMGQLIKNMVENIEKLNETSRNMEKIGNDSVNVMKELEESNIKTVEAVQKVSKNVESTDIAVQKITDAVNLITNIASQTSLLSLNASIEAARAGDAGKGFAVVASEIQKLSVESNSSAQHIYEIIKVLSEDSKSAMYVMEEVKARLKEQEDKLVETLAHFNSVIDGIYESRQSTDEINRQAKDCDKARDAVVDIIQNLSAVSEENAAATEETTASMEELNATMTVVSDSAVQLKVLAQSMDENTRFFRL